MSEVVPKWAEKLSNDVLELQTVPPEWAKKMQGCIDGLYEIVEKVQGETSMIPQIYEMCKANGEGIEVLSCRVDKLEEKINI